MFWIALFLAALAHVQAASPELSRLLELPFARYALFETTTGKRLLQNRASTPQELSAFLDRPGMEPLASDLERNLTLLERDVMRSFPEGFNLRNAEQVRILTHDIKTRLPAPETYFPMTVTPIKGFQTVSQRFLGGTAPSGIFIPRGISRDIEALCQSRRWMEAVWKLRETGDLVTSQTIEASIAEYLMKGEIVHSEPLGGGRTKTFLVTFADGTRGVFKPAQINIASSAKAEVAAYRLDRLLQLDRVPVTVFRSLNGLRGSLQLFVENGTFAAKMTRGFAMPDAHIRIFDYLISNIDRQNGMNYLILEAAEGRQVAIDHGIAFSNWVESKPPVLIREEVDPRIIERLRELTPERIDQELGDLVGQGAREKFMQRRYVLLRMFGG